MNTIQGRSISEIFEYPDKFRSSITLFAASRQKIQYLETPWKSTLTATSIASLSSYSDGTPTVSARANHFERSRSK